MIVVTVGYKPAISFNWEYYNGSHTTLVEQNLRPQGLLKYEVRKAIGTPDGSPAPYQYIWSGYFDSMETVQAVLSSPETAQVLGDIPNFYQGQPDIFITEVSREG